MLESVKFNFLMIRERIPAFNQCNALAEYIKIGEAVERIQVIEPRFVFDGRREVAFESIDEIGTSFSLYSAAVSLFSRLFIEGWGLANVIFNFDS